ncbi:MAG: CBS domain-containing protein [Thermoprotei archaeon]|jgi:predicted transcriptional regulator
MLPELSEIMKLRKKLGLTQRELAKLSGVSQSLIAKIESGKIIPSYSKVKIIFDTLENLEEKVFKVNIKAGDIMNKKVVGVKSNDKVIKASQIMLKHGFSQLPVFSKGRLVGSISEKDIMNILSKGLKMEELSNIYVCDVMDEPFPQIPVKTPLSVISTLLQTFNAVLVVNKGRVAGIITKADVLKVIESNELLK